MNVPTKWTAPSAGERARWARRGQHSGVCVCVCGHHGVGWRGEGSGGGGGAETVSVVAAKQLLIWLKRESANPDKYRTPSAAVVCRTGTLTVTATAPSSALSSLAVARLCP